MIVDDESGAGSSAATPERIRRHQIIGMAEMVKKRPSLLATPPDLVLL